MAIPLINPEALDVLREHLPPAAVADLARGTEPNPALVAGACGRVREELNALASYIPGSIVRRQIANPAPGQVSGAYWDGSILFADMSGFTALSGKLSALGKQGAEEISAIINNLFSALVAEIYRYDGELFKFGGDALTAFFDARQLGRAHAARAARSALAMQERMRAFSSIETRAGKFQLRLRVGVHSGRVFAAEVGDATHIELVVTGRNINRVAEAQEIAEPGEVVVSHETHQLIPGLETIERGSDFYLLQSLPMVVPSSRLRGEVWPEGAGDLDELVAMAHRLVALRPYLPYGLPRRFLEAGDSEIGEFRPVTVLFANFYSFSHALTLFGEDAQSAATALNAYYQRAQSIVHRYGGIVNKVDMYTRGDKLMALFGAPIAHEDDPARAVRCALDLNTMIEEANAEIAPILRGVVDPLVEVESHFLHQKIGINTGVVFAGQVGSVLRHEYTVMGQPVNLAARLMGVAETGTAVLSPSTRRSIAATIAVRELPPVQLKGIPEPVPVVEALYPRVADAPRGGASMRRAEMVGREAELQGLIDIARGALSGSGRIVALVGEMGIGKSRLIAELVSRLLDPHTNVPGFFPCLAECQSYDQNSAYATVREVLSGLLSLSGEPAQVTRRVTRLVADLAPALERFTPVLGDILGVDLPDTQLTSALSPEQRHDRALELIEALVIGSARSQPVVLIIDDMHWADASSLELLFRLARQAPRAPLLVVFAYRSDQFEEPWGEIEGCERFVLGELSDASSMLLVQELLEGESPPALELLLEKTQGNPFFIEAVVTSLIESGALERVGGRWQYTRPAHEVAIPDSIEGVITARLDRLPELLRETIQIAAVVGRRFAYSILDRLIGHREGLIERLDQLQMSDIVAPDGDPGEQVYHFTHALTRDVAYEAILFVRRRELHRRVGIQIEELYTDRLDDQIPLLARHFLMAEEWERAFDYHLRAGRQAQERFANREAIVLFERALQVSHELMVRQSAAPEPLVVELYERLGSLHTLLGEYDTAEDRYESALYIAGRSPKLSRETAMRLTYGLARVDEKRAQFEQAFERVEEALELSGGAPSQEHVSCLLLGAGLHQRLGRYPQAREWGERAFTMANQIGSQRDQAEALLQMGGTLRNLGDNQRAFELTSQSLALFQGTHDLGRVADAHNNLANICFDLGQLTEARVHYEAGAEIKQTIGDIYGQGLIACNLGEVFRIQGEIDAAIMQYAQALTIYERIGSHYMTGVLHMNLGAAHLLRGDLVSAAAHLRPSAELFAEIGAEDFLPELERYQAELELRHGNLELAAQLCEQALTTAIRLEARNEEGVTRRLHAEIMAQAGRKDEAWMELDRSQSILREAASSHELARTLTAIAVLAIDIGQAEVGRAALAEAIPALEEIGALRDLELARAVAGKYD